MAIRLHPMQNEDNVKKITDHPRLQRKQIKLAELEVFRLLESFKKHPGLPINICINGDQLKSAKEQLSLSLSNLLSQEIKLWSEAIGHRPVSTMLFCYPFHQFEPYELTEVLHSLATQFSLSEDSSRIHRVATSLDEINNDHVALLKGLGFNHYQIVVDKSDLDDMSTLLSAVKLIRKFSFQGVGIHIQHMNCLDDLRGQIIDIRQNIAPDFIYLGNRPKLVNLNTHNSPDTIVFDDDNSPLNNTLCLGPEGKSQLQNLAVQNYCNPESYSRALTQNLLPIGPAIEAY